MKSTILLLAALFFVTVQNEAQTVTDIDGNVYNTVNIGSQIWMKENLKVIHYNNGDKISNVADSLQWVNEISGAYCYYYNDSVTYAPTYGALYNFYTVMDSRNVCPIDWHVPSSVEWDTVKHYLDEGWSSIAGGKMKEAGTLHWLSPNTGATNISGFTGLPGGCRTDYGDYISLGKTGYMWSHTQLVWLWRELYLGMAYDLYYANESLNPNGLEFNTGVSIRCIKDTPGSQINENSMQNKVQIYPVPAIDIITINCFEFNKVDITIYNLIGELLMQEVTCTFPFIIDIRNLASGIYIIKLSGADWTVQKKIIKE